MTYSMNRPRPHFARVLCICLITALTSGCGSDPSSPSPDPTANIGDFAGTWTQNGTSGTQDATKSITIAANLSYRQTVRQYETTAKLVLSSTKEVEATVTAITTSETNAAYHTIFVDIDEVQETPVSAAEADEWNTKEYGGVTAWVPGVMRTFNAASPGPWEHGTIWQSHVAVSVRREGDLLNVNERGGFDGQDPPEDTYFLGN